MPVKSNSVTEKKYLGLLALTALGIVFGDIGTSPIYAFREALNSNGALEPNPENILGLLSLMLWSLIIVISIKYLGFVMRADNQGEGGIMALTALVLPPSKSRSKSRSTLVLAGLFGAALLYGDGVITPAISVLSAVEGLEIATPLFSPYVIPLTLAIIVSLFCLQHKGTATVGMWFGPLTLCWFVTLAILGIYGITKNPGVIAAINPIHAMRFFQNGGASSFLVMGSIVLVVTGGEALYADMGHFGIKPIRLAWFFVVFPSLVLNYFGQGAMILHDPNTVDHPFFTCSHCDSSNHNCLPGHHFRNILFD
jgi:KUP system potassium uptake protein